MNDITTEQAREALKELGSERKVAAKLGLNRHAVKRLLAGKPLQIEKSNGGAQKIETALEIQGCTLTATSLSLPKDLAFAGAEKILKQLMNCGEALPWWIGDLLAQSEILYGESYAQLVDPTGREVGTLKNYHWLSTAVESSRRRDDLSWRHHAEVAKLEPKSQDKWLGIASDNKLSTRELHHSIARGKLTRIAEIEKLSGQGSGLKGCPMLHDVLEDFEKWQKKELPGGEDDLNAVGKDELLKMLEIVRPIFAFAVRIQERLKATVDVDIPGMES